MQFAVISWQKRKRGEAQSKKLEVNRERNYFPFLYFIGESLINLTKGFFDTSLLLRASRIGCIKYDGLLASCGQIQAVFQ